MKSTMKGCLAPVVVGFCVNLDSLQPHDSHENCYEKILFLVHGTEHQFSGGDVKYSVGF